MCFSAKLHSALSIDCRPTVVLPLLCLFELWMPLFHRLCGANAFPPSLRRDVLLVSPFFHWCRFCVCFLFSPKPQIPGPTIRMEACLTYQLTVTNALEGPNPGGNWNTMKDPNTTNIHTHGLHLSGESPADDVLYVKITPGEAHTCENAQRNRQENVCCERRTNTRRACFLRGVYNHIVHTPGIYPVYTSNMYDTINRNKWSCSHY